MITAGLSGAVALVTGASGAIGGAVAKTLAAAGADVVLHAREASTNVDAVAAECSATSQVLVVTGDLMADADVQRALEATVDFGAPAIVVNTVGSYPVDPLEDMTLGQWRDVVHRNLDPMFLVTKAFGPAIGRVGGGSIVNIASLSAARPALHQSHYNSAKAAVVAFTRSAAVELAPQRVRVNSVSPGLVNRPGLRESWPAGVDSWIRHCPMGRLGSPRDVANACLFLASPLSSWITGQDIAVDGGISAAPAY